MVKTRGGFEVVENPKFPPREPGRGAPKRELRRALELMKLGESIIASDLAGFPEKADRDREVARVRSRVTAVHTTPRVRRRFSVRVDIEDRVIVTRTK